mmetsp:Transcript_7980/g.18838  ORF Transcript_7980/g.18838 Transcript_7980/m.18838 type:complete len:214 (+) Transcript_7980:371-1012(+)
MLPSNSSRNCTRLLTIRFWHSARSSCTSPSMSRSLAIACRSSSSRWSCSRKSSSMLARQSWCMPAAWACRSATSWRRRSLSSSIPLRSLARSSSCPRAHSSASVCRATSSSAALACIGAAFSSIHWFRSFLSSSIPLPRAVDRSWTIWRFSSSTPCWRAIASVISSLTFSLSRLNLFSKSFSCWCSCKNFFFTRSRVSAMLWSTLACLSSIIR